MAERVATVVAQGEHGRQRAGTGDSFWQYRRYQAGDPVQNIDWRQSAKSALAFVRENEWESAQNIYLWADRSASMNWHSHPDLPIKADRAVVLTLAMASLLIRGGERISRLETGQRPSGGRAVLNRLADELTTQVEDAAGLPRLEQLRRHSRVVMVGDFLSPIHEIEPMIKGYALQGITGHIVQICDPAEEALPYTGRTRFEGLEGEGSALIGRADAVREDYNSLRSAHCDTLTDLCRSAGWTLTVNRTDRPAEPTLLTLHMLMSETVRV
ncbi:MAG: DUF58 domain-containing protein [Rhodospirillaceae bacterium TMED63]|nr:DUF58 domain-containing protein [Rhodospirillaceae bacterium]RPG04419.1 MAG: DUF58 domain-containing protein [Rhodospirillaceae bacterium TMED63]